MTSERGYPQFLLIGDSIIQYSSFLRDGFSFGAALEERKLRVSKDQSHFFRSLKSGQMFLTCKIANEGSILSTEDCGYNTANALVVLQDLVPPSSCAEIDYLLILFGANDACLPGARSGQHVPLEDYKENLKTILRHPSVIAHNPTILLVTPPPINEFHLEQEDLRKGNPALTRNQAFTAQYAGAVRDIAAEFENVVLIDLWTAMMREAATMTPDHGEDKGNTLLGTLTLGDNLGLRHLLVDGLHLTGPGYKVFWDEVLPIVGKTWPTEPFDNPSWVFPHWTVAPRIDKK